MATEKQKEKIIKMLEEGKSIREIENLMGVPRSTIQYISRNRKKESEDNSEEYQDCPPIDPANFENQVENNGSEEENFPDDAPADDDLPDDELSDDAPADDDEIFPSDELENEDPEDLHKEENDDSSDMQQETEGSDFIPAIASLVKVLETGNTNLVRAIENTEKIESVVKSSVAVATAEFQKTIELASQNLNFATKTIEDNAERFKVSAENSVKPSGSSIPAQNESLFRIHLLFALLVYLLVFFMAIPLTRDVIYIINGVMFFCASLLTGLALIRKSNLLAFSAAASSPLPFVLFAGYYCTLLDPAIGKSWLYGLLAVPAALIITAIIYLKTKARGDK